MEKPISFSSEAYRISGLMDDQGTQKAVVITHPYPLYGGDMHNPVVAVLQRAYGQAGYTTLRFDFRGVGASEGRYTDGQGEIVDVLAALSHVADMGISDIDLAGYSFGAWVNAQIPPEEAFAEEMVMVSPPVAFIDFEPMQKIPNLKLVITGSRDDIAPAHMIRERLPSWNPASQFEIIAGADHFYSGYADSLASTLMAHIKTI